MGSEMCIRDSANTVAIVAIIGAVLLVLTVDRSGSEDSLNLVFAIVYVSVSLFSAFLFRAVLMALSSNVELGAQQLRLQLQSRRS